MKLNLKCGNDVRNGYVNIDPTKRGDGITNGNLESLDWLCEDNTVEEILAVGAMRYIDNNNLGNAMANWCKKLRTNGTIKIEATDLFIISKLFAGGQITIEEYTSALYGTDIPFRSSTDIDAVQDKLESLGLSVTQRRLNGTSFVLEACKC